MSGEGGPLDCRRCSKAKIAESESPPPGRRQGDKRFCASASGCTPAGSPQVYKAASARGATATTFPGLAPRSLPSLSRGSKDRGAEDSGVYSVCRRRRIAQKNYDAGRHICEIVPAVGANADPAGLAFASSERPVSFRGWPQQGPRGSYP
ncbi:hypothetical protein MTO96_011035 [Rhipicephalus appendiculatus]